MAMQGKSSRSTKRRCLHNIESEKQVRELLNACTIQGGNDANSGNYYFKISSKRIKAKEVCYGMNLNAICLLFGRNKCAFLG